MGIEALLQLLAAYCIERGLAEGIPSPRFQSPALGVEQRWKYRGQVQPSSKEVLADIEVKRIEREDGTVLVVAEGNLWVDGLRIYEVGNLAVRIVPGDAAIERPSGPFDTKPAVQFWRDRLRGQAWPGEELTFSLAERFVARVVPARPDLPSQLAQQRALFVANHQVGIESPLFSVLVAALNRRPILAIAKREHAHSWLGRLLQVVERYPHVSLPSMLRFFDREDQASFFRLLESLGEDIARDDMSILVHAPGTRAMRAGEPVTRLSGALLDFGISNGLPVVPVRFANALPRQAAAERLEFPAGYGRQDIYLGEPIPPARLAALPLKERKDHVLSALNALGPPLAEESPNAPDAAFADEVARLMRTLNLGTPQAVVLQTLRASQRPGPLLRRVIDAVTSGQPASGSDAESAWGDELRRWFALAS